MTRRRSFLDDDHNQPRQFEAPRDFISWRDRPSEENFNRRAAWCLRFGSEFHLLKEWNHQGRVLHDEDLLKSLISEPWLTISERQRSWLERIEQRIEAFCWAKFGE